MGHKPDCRIAEWREPEKNKRIETHDPSPERIWDHLLDEAIADGQEADNTPSGKEYQQHRDMKVIGKGDCEYSHRKNDRRDRNEYALALDLSFEGNYHSSRK